MVKLVKVRTQGLKIQIFIFKYLVPTHDELNIANRESRETYDKLNIKDYTYTTVHPEIIHLSNHIQSKLIQYTSYTLNIYHLVILFLTTATIHTSKMTNQRVIKTASNESVPLHCPTGNIQCDESFKPNNIGDVFLKFTIISENVKYQFTGSK